MSAGAALRTTAEEMVRAGRAQPAPGTAAGAAPPARADDTLRAGRAQPAPGAARALRVVSILVQSRWLRVSLPRVGGGDRRALKITGWLRRRSENLLKAWRPSGTPAGSVEITGVNVVHPGCYRKGIVKVWYKR